MERRPWTAATAVTLAAVCAGAAMFAWMLRPVLAGRIPFTGDLLHFHYPLRDFYARALRSGWSFEWMPTLYAGFDVVGEGQVGAYHPAHWLLYRWLPLDTAFGIETVAPYPILFVGTWLFLRRACDGRAAAAFGALLFTFCGFNLSHGVHLNLVLIVAHVPWLLWAIHLTFTATEWRSRARGAATIALLTGSECLLGYPQALWFSALIEVAYFALLLASRSPNARLSSLSVVAAAKALGIMIGAAQLAATLHVLPASQRAAVDPSFALQFSLPSPHLLQFVGPYLMWGRVLRWNELTGGADEYGAYGGAVALSLAIWWLASYRRARSEADSASGDRVALWGLALALVGCCLALGAVGRLYLLEIHLPVVRWFREPARYVLFTHLGLGIAAAVSLGALLAPAGRRRGALWVPWALAAFSAVAAVWWVRSGTPPPNGSATAASVALGPILFVAAAALITAATRGARWAPAALVLLAAGDQALYGIAGVIGWQDYVTRQDVLTILRDDTRGHVPSGPSRIARGGNPNVLLLGGYHTLEGYSGLEPVRLLDYRSPQALSAASVEYVHADLQREAQLPRAQSVSNTWFRIPPPADRVRLITDVRVSSQPRVDITAIDVARTALATHDLVLDGGPAGTAKLAQDRPGDIRVRTSASSRQLLVVSEGYDEGWIATVDGQPVPVERIDGDFIGCLVPASTHDVSLRFEPAWRRAGRIVSMLGLVVAMALLLTSVAR